MVTATKRAIATAARAMATAMKRAKATKRANATDGEAMATAARARQEG
jgi:hypothetical protein